MSNLEVKSVVLGEGKPKICIPLVGGTLDELLEEVKVAQAQPCQLLEWRADYFLKELNEPDIERSGEELFRALGYLRQVIELPLIFTLRTEQEGGMIHLSRTDYYIFNSIVAHGGLADLIDIELFDSPGTVDEEVIREFIKNAHERGAKILLSNHDFEKTPSVEDMLARFFAMQDLGGDILKLSVMPQDEQDVIHLLEVTALMRDSYAEKPLIAIAMGELGMSTRICGGEFGSAITYAAGKAASAPGQIDAVSLDEYLAEYY